EVLELAASCYDMSGLGYIGTDIVLDRDKGPMLLELNARPGLAIQICNNAGLLPRLRLIEAMTKKHRLSIEQRVAFSMQHFGVFNE
ncbi:MAG: sugar-transfer associated ATP-grasp domain-containing protein, partial [Succinivibrio sp.]|nr:sugar-transfer associated ATP-grasp domain-containing protein [Succinivibrio sp.]